MPVIYGAGLAGKVVQATGGRSTVQLSTDPEFKVCIRILSNNRTGTATGRGPGEQLIVDTSLTPEDAEVRRGTALTTSGTDNSAFPASIPIGRVRSTKESTSGLTVDLMVEPAADTERLRSEEHTSELQSLMRISYAVF